MINEQTLILIQYVHNLKLFGPSGSLLKTFLTIGQDAYNPMLNVIEILELFDLKVLNRFSWGRTNEFCK